MEIFTAPCQGRPQRTDDPSSRRKTGWSALVLCAAFAALSACAGTGHGPDILLDPPPAPVVAASDSTTFSVKPVGWSPLGGDSSEFLLEIAVVNHGPRAALLSPDSLSAVLRIDAVRKRPNVVMRFRPTDFWDRQARLVEAARVEHDPANPYHPDLAGVLYYGLTKSRHYDRKLSEYQRDKWNESQWDKQNGGMVNSLDPALFEWRKRALRDTLLWANWEAKMLFAIPACRCEGSLAFHLRFGGVTDSVVFRQRLRR